MSALWNGHAMPSRAETVATRCLDIIERGMARLGLERAPAALNQVLAAPRSAPQRMLTREEVAARNAKIVAAWQSAPLEKRSMNTLCKRYQLTYETMRRILLAAGLRHPAAKAQCARTSEERRARVLAAWAKWGGAASVDAVARHAGTKYLTARTILLEEGLVDESRFRRRAA
jgi:hypothetical protein